jgi:hypothetical protein
LPVRKSLLSTPHSFGILILLTFTCLLLSSSALAESPKPVFLYSRYFNAKGETRYLPDGTYKDVLDKLRDHFEVRVHDLPLNEATLKDVAVVLISNPSDKAAGNNPPPPHCSAEDVRQLTRFVNNGGGLIAMGNQENHNLEIKDFNQLLDAFGMKFENRYTDVKKLAIPKDVPIIGGLRWAYYTGNQVVVDPHNGAMARGLVMNDLNQKPERGNRDEVGILLAVAEPGKGHVVVATDAGWISNDALSGKGIGASRSKNTTTGKYFSVFRAGRRAAGNRAIVLRFVRLSVVFNTAFFLPHHLKSRAEEGPAFQISRWDHRIIDWCIPRNTSHRSGW